MIATVRSFAKINVGLAIGASRPDRFHELRTVYQTIALHDMVRVNVARGSGIEIRCDDSRVPTDQSNTCYRIAEQTMAALKARGRVVIEIEKRLPIQGGLGGASGNAVATLLALEIALRKKLSAHDRFRIASEIGSDVPLFLVGGTVIGLGRGEEVYPLQDLPAMHCVIATPAIGVSTPKAFAAWDELQSDKPFSGEGAHAMRRPATRVTLTPLLTSPAPSDRLKEFGHAVSSWLSLSGVPVKQGGGRVETLLLDLVRTGIENDFEKVVFPQNPALRDVKKSLHRSGAIYASLSGSGSALYGIFGSKDAAVKAAQRLERRGVPAVATTTLTRRQYWRKLQIR